MIKVSKYITATLSSVALLFLNGCGSASSNSDSSTADTVQAAIASSDGYTYNSVRAKALCDKYGSGMLSEADYTEMLAMVRVAYLHRWEELRKLTEASASADEFRAGYMQTMQTLSAQYPYAEFLAKICDETPVTQLGSANTQKLDSLKSEMKTSYDAVSELAVSKFGNDIPTL